MGSADDAQALPYPMPNPTALEPPAEWAWLRRECPVATVTLPSGDAASLVTRYADVRTVLSDPRCTRELSADGAARIADTDSGGVFSSDLASRIPQAGEGHQQWRRRVTRWFTVKRMAALRPGIVDMTDRLIDEMVERGRPAELRASLGFPLPVWVICDLLGAPERDRDRFAYWSDTLLTLTRYGEAEVRQAQAEFAGYMSDRVAEKRAEPGDDLLSTLATADAEDGGMSDSQLVATGAGLLVAGHETTANMIGKMLAMLLAERQRWEQLVADPSLVRTAVEEVLRFDANPGIGMPRYVGEDIEIDGTRLPAGTTVMCSTGAANRDETAFDRAAELDLERSPNPHLSFGLGAHACLGQALARVELQVVLEVLLRRLPTLELAVPAGALRAVEGLAIGGLREVPVRW